MRWNDWLKVVAFLLIAGGVGIGLIYWTYYRARNPGFAYAGAQECRAAYARAATLRDSAIVDARWPGTGAPKDPNAPTCRSLRLTGQLR